MQEAGGLREADGEGSALSGPTGRPDAFLYGLGQVFDDGEAQPGAPSSRERVLSTR